MTFFPPLHTPHFETRRGIVPHFKLVLSSLVWENRKFFLLPAMPLLSRSCQTPRVINPKHNENNSCGVTQRHKLLSDGPVMSILVHKQMVQICRGGGGVNGPLTKATCNWLTGQEKLNTLSKLGYQLHAKQEIFFKQGIDGFYRMSQKKLQSDFSHQ